MPGKTPDIVVRFNEPVGIWWTIHRYKDSKNPGFIDAL